MSPLKKLAQTFKKALPWPQNCALHGSYHAPHSEIFAGHHIQPESWGGPTASWNLATVCPTGHTNVHWLIDQLVGGAQKARKADPEARVDRLTLKDVTSAVVLRRFRDTEIALAEKGWSSYWKTNGHDVKVPNRTL
jgi:hypothetical protein